MQLSIIIKTSVVIIIFATGSILLNKYHSPAYSNDTGAPVGKTGSPGDGSNCTGCHSGIATMATGFITSDIPASGYVPGDTYTITGTITADGINKFGFEVSPQKSTGTLKGIMVITDAVNTKLIGSGKYITHTAAGTSGDGSRTWSFDWIAPVAGTGDVTFYGAFVAANGNGLNTGDHVYLSNLPVHEHLATGIDVATETNNFIVYPNPVTDILFYKNINTNETILKISIMDISGKLIQTINNNELLKDQEIDISNLQNGMYVLNIVSEKGTIAKKFIKN